MLKIEDLNLGFSDAENYKRRENKELLNHLFLRTSSLEKLCSPSTTFLVGEKGTGKTAYAVYMSNNSYGDNLSSLRYIRETEYQKFITLKNEKHLDLSDYSSIWKVIIYLLLSEQIYQHEGKDGLFKRFSKFQALHDAIQEYYLHAFSPEIIHALQFVRESKLVAELLSKHAKAKGEQTETIAFSESRFQTNLLYIQKNFEQAISSLKLDKSHIIFIDGIDIRPSTIPFDEYLDCIKGLANAVWEINNDFFPSIRDSKGRLRAVLLVRPDIFALLGLQNQNTKIRDNAALLDWSTAYKEHRSSDLFSVSDQILKHQQEEAKKLDVGDSWDYYFPFDTPNLMTQFEKPSSFVSFLRFALYRPRDIVTMLSMLQETFVRTSKDKNRSFSQDDFEQSSFRRNYADYLLGEVKDQLAFYYGDDEYENFLKFFEFLDGKNKFTYDEYIKAYANHQKYLNQIDDKTPRFMSTAPDFLQFLYDLNVICFIERTEEGKPHIHWCFRDRTYSNISPKVKLRETYEIFYGMSKALNTGKKLSRGKA
ncbi:P-loop ATPase, Sll1717 family [Candidatus Thalassolituus haligoni]|uniref:P-loop ATPase, Sll1717 family n=1 Tax=Candidatus Thalassolituus haligoni TaxID=3100113 RepID=UPI0035159FC9